MSYMQDVDNWLTSLLGELPPERLAEAKTEIKARLLESYRNGQTSIENPKRQINCPVADRRPAPRRFRRSNRHGR